MESAPPIDDEPIKNEKKTKSSSTKLNVETLFAGAVEKKDKDKGIIDFFRPAETKLPKESDLVELDKGEAKPADKTSEPDLDIVLETEAQDVIVESSTDQKIEPEDSLFTADEAWEKVKPIDQVTETEDAIKAELPTETTETIEEYIEVAQEAPVQTVIAPSSETVEAITDHEVHDFPKETIELHQAVELETVLVINHEPELTEGPHEEQIEPDEESAGSTIEPALSSETDHQTAEPELVAESTEGDGGAKPPRSTEELEASEPPEPERPPVPVSDNETDQVPPRAEDELPTDEPAETIEPVSELPLATHAVETRIIERHYETSQVDRLGTVFNWLKYRQLRNELRRGQRQQKRQVKQFANQQQLANEQTKRQLDEQKSLAERTRTKLTKQLTKITKIVSKPATRPEIGHQPAPVIIEKQTITKQTVVERIKEKIPSLPNLPSKRIERRPEKIRNPLVRLKREVRPTLSPVEKYAVALERTAARLKNPPEKRPSFINSTKPETNWLPSKAEEHPSRPRHEAVPQPIQSAVAEAAIEHAVHLSPDHHLERSAWHSIEVDKTGRAVEQPVFAYGQEFLHEQHPETWHDDLPGIAMPVGQIVINDNNGSTPVTNVSPQPQSATLAPNDLKIPIATIEKVANELSRRQLTSIIIKPWPLVTVVAILLILAGVIFIR